MANKIIQMTDASSNNLYPTAVTQDISDSITMAANIEDTNYTTIKTAKRTGNVVSLKITFHPIFTNLINKTLATISGAVPSAAQTIPCYVIPVYNEPNRSIVVQCIIDTSGNIRTNNNGGYGETASMTDLTEITIAGTYVV